MSPSQLVFYTAANASGIRTSEAYPSQDRSSQALHSHPGLDGSIVSPGLAPRQIPSILDTGTHLLLLRPSRRKALTQVLENLHSAPMPAFTLDQVCHQLPVSVNSISYQRSSPRPAQGKAYDEKETLPSTLTLLQDKRGDGFEESDDSSPAEDARS